MTYYGKQRMEAFKRAFFANRLNELSTAVPAPRSESSRDEQHTIRIPGVLTSAGLAAGQLAS
jgi:hypothetical protein